MTTTTIQPDNLALAGLENDKGMLLTVARILLADIYWDEDRSNEYHRASKKSFWEQDLMKRPETPQIPDETDALIRMAALTGRIEQAWGESFYSVARRICPDDQIQLEVHEDLLYYTCMACIGRGIGPEDMAIAKFPEELDGAPIHIENPMLFQLALLDKPEPTEESNRTTSFTPAQMEIVSDWVDNTANDVARQINLLSPLLTDLDKRPRQVYSPEQPDVFFRYVHQAMLEDLIDELKDRV